MDARNGGRIRGRVRVEERREEGWNGGEKEGGLEWRRREKAKRESGMKGVFNYLLFHIWCTDCYIVSVLSECV